MNHGSVSGNVGAGDDNRLSPNVSLPLFMRTLCMIIVHFIFVSAGSKQGSVTLAANTVIIQLFVVFSYFMDGFANAGEALVGRAIGGCNKEMYDTTVRSLFVWVVE